MKKELSETRKADRPKMAAEVIKIVKSFGGIASICDTLSNDDQIYIEIETARGLGLFLEFEKKSCHPIPNTFVLSWHFKQDTYKFTTSAFQSVNNYHYRKGTDVVYGFDNLCSILRNRLEKDLTGELYQ